MTTTATSWRDFVDHLPPHVIARFERHEQLSELHGPLAFPEEDPAEVIRRDQQMMFEEARDQVPFAHVPLPPCANWADLWDEAGDGSWSRVVDGTSRQTGPLAVNITGVQSSDGSVSWSVSADTKDYAVSPEQLREYAVMVVEAADELDRLNGV